jgi:hypothetical protein
MSSLDPNLGGYLKLSFTMADVGNLYANLRGYFIFFNND